MNKLQPSSRQYSASWLASLSKKKRDAFLENLTPAELLLLQYDWHFWARREQLAPAQAWRVWLILAGRGWGKTHTGAAWLAAQAYAQPQAQLAIVGETMSDARSVMVEGTSGILGIAPPWARPRFYPSKRLLVWPNGSRASLFSADDPEQLRGPQFHAAWGDELAKWKHAAAWDNLQLCLRLGKRPQVCVTTTPRPTVLLKTVMQTGKCHITRGSTFDNAANLAKGYLAQVTRLYDGTRLGRQELYAELLEDTPNALWQRAWIDAARCSQAPALQQIVVAIDPAVSTGKQADETGIVVAGRDNDGLCYVLADASGKYSPDAWARKALALYEAYQANQIVAEANNGGQLVLELFRHYERSAPVQLVHASRGKLVRAEPVAALYEQGRVRHVGTHPLLEDQLCQFTGTGSQSPDRLDACVWAIAALTTSIVQRMPRVRGFWD